MNPETFYICNACGRAFADKAVQRPIDIAGILYPENEVGLRVYDGPQPDGEVVVYIHQDAIQCCKDNVVLASSKGVRFRRTPERGVEIVGVVRLPE